MKGEPQFRVLELRDCTPQEWLRSWASRYPMEDEPEYEYLIARHAAFSSDDFERIGKWKDGVTTKTLGKWKPNVAMVAYEIWMRIAMNSPKDPAESGVESFLEHWSEQTYIDVFPNKSVVKHFGLSRATTLLHFVSGGRFPIFDSRVRTAVARLLGSKIPPDSVRWYCDQYRALFADIASRCEADSFRQLDRALFTYGSMDKLYFKASSNSPSDN
jgi:hypothetical protein